MKTETWKPVVGYEGFYEVSSMGRVRSLDRMQHHWVRESPFIRRGRIIKSAKDRHGYLRTRLSANGRQQTPIIHRLVAMAFIPNPNNYPMVNHIDSTRDNNCVENLEWCTGTQNMRHGMKYGRAYKNMPSGEDHKLSKTTNKQKLEILNLYHSGKLSRQEIADKYGISRRNVGYIAKQSVFIKKHLNAG